MYVDPIICQIFECAVRTPYENNPQIVTALDPESNQNVVLTPQPFKKEHLLLFDPTRVQSSNRY